MNIFDSIKNISNESEKITTPSNLETLLTGEKKKLKNKRLIEIITCARHFFSLRYQQYVKKFVYKWVR